MIRTVSKKIYIILKEGDHMPSKDQIIIAYLCQELLKNNIITESTANSVCQKLLTSESNNARNKKAA